MKPWRTTMRSTAPPPLYSYHRGVGGVRLDRRGLVKEIEVNDLDDRIALIRQQTALGVRDPRLHALAYAITQKCPERDDACEARAIFDWITQRVCRWNAAEQKTVCQARIRYVGEPADFDTYRSPMQTLDIRAGDCDDGLALGAALGLINGFYVRATVTSNEGKTADHIYPEFALPKGEKAQWLPLDWTLGPGKFGRHPPQAKRWTFPVEAMPTDLPAGMRPGRGAVGRTTPLAGADDGGGGSGSGSTALVVAVIAGAVAVAALIIHTRRGA